MKKIFILIFIFNISIKSYAQITFSKDDLFNTTPTAIVNLLGNVELPAFGAGKTWDYSDLQQADTSVEQFHFASSSQYFNKFPQANLVYIAPGMEEEESSLSLYKVGENGLYLYGIYHPSYDSVFLSDKPTLYLPAPITYNQTVTDSARESNDYVGGDVGFHHSSFSKVKYTAVGYGNISTPAGKYENTLLIRKVEYFYDTTSYDDDAIPSIVYLDTLIEYSWIQKNKNLPVVFRMELNKEESEVLAVSYATNNVILGVASNEVLISKQYPNPANDEVNIEFSKSQQGLLTFYSLDGQVKLKQEIDNSSKITLDIKTLEPGIYFYDVATPTGVSGKNKVVVTH